MGEHIIGVQTWGAPSGDLKVLTRPRRAVVLLYLITDAKGGRLKPPFTPGLTLLFPPNKIESPLTFAVVRKDMASAVVVPRPKFA